MPSAKEPGSPKSPSTKRAEKNDASKGQRKDTIALIDKDDMDAEAIARKAMEIAAQICVYTNTNVVIQSL